MSGRVNIQSKDDQSLNAPMKNLFKKIRDNQLRLSPQYFYY